MHNLAVKNTNNIVMFSNNSVMESINSFFKTKKMNFQDNTATNYLSHYKEFFRFVLNKELETLTWQDVCSITTKCCEAYQEYLLNEKQLARTTINAKFSAISSLYKKFYKDNKSIDPSVVSDVAPLVIFEDEDTKSWGSLSEEEVEKLYSFCDKQLRQALEKRMFFELSIVTGLRQDAILNLTWNDITQKQSAAGSIVWVIYVNQKRNKVHKPISDNLYNKLQELKREKSNKLFKICDVTLRQTLADFCSSININQEERRIALHSLKKTSANMVYDNTRDITVTAQHSSHKSITTTYNNYISKQKDYTAMPSYSMFENNTDFALLETATQEKLLAAIKQLPKNTQREIINKLKAL